MIRVGSAVGWHLLGCGLHGSKVIAHPRKTGKRCGWHHHRKGLTLLAKGAKERAQLFRQQLRFFGSGEVPTTRHFGPVLNVVSAFDPGARRKRFLLWKMGDGAGHMHEIALLKVKRRLSSFVIQTKRGVDRFRHPVECYVGQKFITPKSAVKVAIAVGPVAELFEYPGGQGCGRIVQTISRSQWVRSLNV